MTCAFKKVSFVFCPLLTCAALPFLHADTAAAQPKKEQPLPNLTGPLLTPSANITPHPHWDIEPYFYAEVEDGVFDSHWKGHSAEHNFYSVYSSTLIEMGLSENVDFEFFPKWSWNHEHGHSHWVVNDMNVQFDFQLLSWERYHWWPSIELSVAGTLPFGKYQKLNPNDLGTDEGGGGTWNPGLFLTMAHKFHISGPIFFVPRWSIQYQFPTPVHVKGLNAYGGGHGTHGKAYPGQFLNFYFGFELSLPKKWALAYDLLYTHYNKTRFSGYAGKTDGVTNPVGSPSSEQFSMAPALEYDWNENYGVVGGVWFTFAGRNSSQFVQGVIALNVSY